MARECFGSSPAACDRARAPGGRHEPPRLRRARRRRAAAGAPRRTAAASVDRAIAGAARGGGTAPAGTVRLYPPDIVQRLRLSRVARGLREGGRARGGGRADEG